MQVRMLKKPTITGFIDMKKTTLLKGIIVATLIFVAPLAHAQVSNQYWKLLGGVLIPNIASWQFELPYLPSQNCVGTDANGLFIAGTCGGAATTPGGLNLQVQYNNAGAFGGISGAVTNGTILNLTNPLLGGATLTTSSVNGVTLTTAGSATTFLNGAGAYTTPAGSTITGTQGQDVYIGPAGTALATSTIFISSNGSTGIGTTTYSGVGTAALTLVGNSTINPSDTSLAIVPISASGQSRINFQDSNDNSKYSIGYRTNDTTFDISQAGGLNSGQILTINASGFLGIGTTTPTNPLTLPAGTQSIPSLSFGDTGTGLYRGAAGTVNFASTGSSVGYWNSGGLFANAFSNPASQNNSTFIPATTGATISRNLADANTALTVTQANAGSTGDILDLKNSAGVQAVVTQAGFLDLGASVGTTSASALTLSSNVSANGITLYNTADQSTNFERGNIMWTGNQFNILTSQGGTGSQRSFKFGVASASQIVLNAASLGGQEDFNGFTTSTAGAFGYEFATFNSTAASGIATVMELIPTINQSSTAGYTGLLIDPTETALGSGTKLLLQVGTSTNPNLFDVTNAGVASSTGFNITGNELVTGNVTWPALGTPAGAFLAVNPQGQVITTTTPSGGAGTVTSVSGSGGTTGLTLTGGPITTSGTLTLGGTLGVANGGTGSTTLGALLAGGGATVYSVSTSTLTASSPLTGSFTQLGTGGSLGCQTASASQAGCLSSTDWTTFNNKGSGTVTAIGVTTANGVSGVSSGGATPNLTITLGAITPTTVNGLALSLGFGSLTTNVAVGAGTLSSASLTGSQDTANGYNALLANTGGSQNTANGYASLIGNTAGAQNTAIGADTLVANSTGSNNVAIGYTAGYHETGSNDFYVNNVFQSSLANDKAFSLLYGTFSGTAGSLTGQQLTVNGAFNISPLATPAGAFLAVSASGQVIATTSPSGGYSPVGTTGQFPYFSATNTLTATSSLFLGTNSFVGIGSTTPYANLSVLSIATSSPIFQFWGPQSIVNTTAGTTTITSTGSWTPPANLVSAVVYSIGGGGAGGSGGNSGQGGGGGGGGSTNFAAATPCIATGGGGGAAGNSIPTSIGGNGGDGSGGNGGAGNASTGGGLGAGAGSGAEERCVYTGAGIGSSAITVTVGTGASAVTSGSAAGGTGFKAGGTGTTSNGGAGGGGGGSTGAGNAPVGVAAGVGGTGASSGGTTTNGNNGGNGSGGSPGSGGANIQGFGGGGGGASGSGNSGSAGAVLITYIIYNTSPMSVLGEGSIFDSTTGDYFPAVGAGTTTPTAAFTIQDQGNAGTLGIEKAFDVWGIINTTDYLFQRIDQFGHMFTGGVAPTCGTGCVSVTGDDRTMEVLTGSSVTSVTVNFANTWSKHPICIPTDESGVNTGVEASTTVSAVTLTLATALTTKNVGIACQSSNNFTY